MSEIASTGARPAPLDVAQAYDRWAAHYDDNENATRDLDASVLRRAPLSLEGADVIEVGCGTGKNTVWLAKRARHVLAMDFSPGMLASARKRVTFANTRFVQHDIRDRWPVEEGSADVVIGNLVLEHVEVLDHVFAEAVRAIRPGGQFFLCELHPFKQLGGGQARFTDPVSGEVVLVQAFRHSTSEYVNGGIAAGFILRNIGEWRDAHAAEDAPPRLLSVLFESPVT
ncbi:MAG: putative methyltransferase [Gemmatimonadetes bacterium]|nr:putative methyltransferase [Gemmatimonadota bacterium]